MTSTNCLLQQYTLESLFFLNNVDRCMFRRDLISSLSGIVQWHFTHTHASMVWNQKKYKATYRLNTNISGFVIVKEWASGKLKQCDT